MRTQLCPENENSLCRRVPAHAETSSVSRGEVELKFQTGGMGIMNQEIYQKLTILAAAAKYDVSCSSSGNSRKGVKSLGSAANAGICHTWGADGRCISLLKILMTNHCIYDCAYCVNRSSNDIARASFTPEEVVCLLYTSDAADD